MAPPSFIYFILIQSCIWRIWFLIESLPSTHPSSTNPYPLHWGIFYDLHYLSNLPVPCCQTLKHSLPAYWNSLGSTSSLQCMYAKLKDGMGGRLQRFWQTYFWKISPVFWKPATLWQSHWYVKSYLGSDMWNFFSISQGFLNQTVEMYRPTVCEHIAKLLYAPTSSLHWDQGNLCG